MVTPTINGENNKVFLFIPKRDRDRRVTKFSQRPLTVHPTSMSDLTKITVLTKIIVLTGVIFFSKKF